MAIARALIRRGFTVAITGDAADKWVRPAFAALPIIDLIDATSLIDLLALYRGCAAVVAHDCGPMHLAIAAGTPTVAIFGPTMPAEKVRPSAAAAVIWGGGHLACRPCYDGRTYAPCADNQCLKTVGISEVMAALDGVIAAAHPLAAERPETLGQRRSAGASR